MVTSFPLVSSYFLDVRGSRAAAKTASTMPTKGSTDVGNDATMTPNLPLLSLVPFVSSPHRSLLGEEPRVGACELHAHCRLVFGVGYHRCIRTRCGLSLHFSSAVKGITASFSRQLARRICSSFGIIAIQSKCDA